MSNKNKFMFFANFKAIADRLDDNMRLKFYDAITNYVFNGIEPDDVIISALLEAIKPSLDKNDNRGGVREGAGAPKNNQNAKNKQSKTIKNNQNNQPFLETETETETETERESVERKPKNDFSPPTLEQVLEYARQQNEMAFVGGFKCSQQTATEFFCHYDAIGWVIGNETKTPIKNWQSKLRLWALSPNKYKTKQEIIDDDIPDAPICVAR